MTRDEAIDWLFEHLEGEIRTGGCCEYVELGACRECERNLKELAEVKQVLGRDE